MMIMVILIVVMIMVAMMIIVIVMVSVISNSYDDNGNITMVAVVSNDDNTMARNGPHLAEHAAAALSRFVVRCFPDEPQ